MMSNNKLVRIVHYHIVYSRATVSPFPDGEPFIEMIAATVLCAPNRLYTTMYWSIII
jgi:hypothetical protein